MLASRFALANDPSIQDLLYFLWQPSQSRPFKRRFLLPVSGLEIEVLPEAKNKRPLRVPKYTTNEFAFNLPETLHDRSMHIFALSDHGPSDLSIVISRSAVDASATLAGQFAALMSELAQQLPGYQVLDRSNRVLAGSVQAAEMRYTYKHEGVPLLQRLVGMLLPAKGRKGQTWVAITATFGPKAGPDGHQSFDAILSSLVIA